MTDRTVTTSGVGTATELPDIAAVHAQVAGEADEIRTARRVASDREASLRASLEDAGIPDGRVRRTAFRLDDQRDGFEVSPDDPDYRAVASFVIDCVPETADSVVVAAADAGATIEQVRFDVGDEARERLEDEALGAAMRAARRKAERLAATEDCSIETVQSVETEQPGGMSSIVEEALWSPETAFQPTAIEVEREVRVTYELGTEDGA